MSDSVDYHDRYDRPPRPGEPDPDLFFGERGFTLQTYVAEGSWWADLVSIATNLRVPRYGQAGDAERAALAAMRRWLVEQAT